jgi:hypothetical protein
MTVMALLFGVPALESTRHAKLSLRATLDEIEGGEHDLNEELARHVLKLRAIRLPGASTERVDLARLKPLLLQCRKVRMKLQTLSKKRLALENHMDTLDNSELNQHVLHSMQKTSHALKGMGLDKTLESVDRVMMDLEENHGDISSIQNSLSNSFDNTEEFDWEAEMAMLLQTDSYCSTNTDLSVPVTANAISSEEEPVSAQPVAVAVAVAADDSDAALVTAPRLMLSEDIDTRVVFLASNI